MQRTGMQNTDTREEFVLPTALPLCPCFVRLFFLLFNIRTPHGRDIGRCGEENTFQQVRSKPKLIFFVMHTCFNHYGLPLDAECKQKKLGIADSVARLQWHFFKIPLCCC